MANEAKKGSYKGVEDLYRENWKWDKVSWASHCIDCYPGNCPMRVYVKDGIAWREEPAAVFPTVEEGVPDLNPMGCQKGAGWTRTLYGKERVLYPLKRVGERGEGKWQRVSWDQAATEIADAVLDAVAEVGAESVIAPSGCNTHTFGTVARQMYMSSVGGLTMDVNAEMNDFAPGHYLTYGTFDPVSSIDDWFHAGLILIWNGNPVYTRIPHYHFIAEARYKGAEVYTIAPDVSPSAVHADYYLGVVPGSDAALALGAAYVVLEEGLVDEKFAREQTDLPLLMNAATSRYLRESDMTDGGSDVQFYVWDRTSNAPIQAPRGTLFWGDAEADFFILVGDRQNEIGEEPGGAHADIHGNDHVELWPQVLQQHFAAPARTSYDVAAAFDQNPGCMFFSRIIHAHPPIVINRLLKVFVERSLHGGIVPVLSLPGLGIAGMVIPEEHGWDHAAATPALGCLNGENRRGQGGVRIDGALYHRLLHIGDGSYFIRPTFCLHGHSKPTVEHACQPCLHPGALSAPVAGQSK